MVGCLEEEEDAQEKEDDADGGDGQCDGGDVVVAGAHYEPGHQSEADDERAAQAQVLARMVGTVVGNGPFILIMRHLTETQETTHAVG